MIRRWIRRRLWRFLDLKIEWVPIEDFYADEMVLSDSVPSGDDPNAEPT